MAAEETPLGNWNDSLRSIHSPRLRWRGRRTLGLFLAATVFVLVSFLFPQKYVALASNGALDVSKEADKLAAQIETLKEEKILDPTRAAELKKKLEQMEAEAQGGDPAKTLEALDHLEKEVQRAAKEAAEAALSKTEKLTKAEELADALHEGGSTMEPKLAKEAMTELAEMVKKAAEESQLALDQETMEAAKAGELSSEQMKKIAESMKMSKKEIKEMLEKLKEAGLVDAETLQQCEKMGESDGSSLAEFLKENYGEMSLEEMLEAEGGQGGVDRGRGDAEMTWTDGTSEDGVKFKKQVLPPGALKQLKESKMLGVSKAAPSEKNKPEVAKTGALKGAASGGGSAHTQVILPRHRGTVERYFERK